MEDMTADLPLGGLPSGQRVQLRGHHIEAAICEIRFVSGSDSVSDEKAQLILSALGEPLGLTRIEPALQQQIEVKIVGGRPVLPSVDLVDQGWRYSSADMSRVVTVMPSIVSLQVATYERWSTTLRPALEALLVAVDMALKPSMVQRIGLRYVNRLSDPEVLSATDWVGRIDPELLGVIRHTILGSYVRNMQQQVDLALEDGKGAVLRHGLVPGPPAGDYLIDLDVFDEVAHPFAAESVLNRAQRMNRTAFAIFQQLLTTKQLMDMDPVDLDVRQEEGERQ